MRTAGVNLGTRPELGPGGPEFESPIPPQQPLSPIPLRPLRPNPPSVSLLKGSPIRVELIATGGTSSATVAGNGNFGSGCVTGGIKVMRATRGGAPRRAGNSDWLLPPACCPVLFAMRRGGGASGVTKRRGAAGGGG